MIVRVSGDNDVDEYSMATLDPSHRSVGFTATANGTLVLVTQALDEVMLVRTTTPLSQ